MEAFLSQPLDPAVLADLEQACLLKGEEWDELLRKFDPKQGGSIDVSTDCFVQMWQLLTCQVHLNRELSTGTETDV